MNITLAIKNMIDTYPSKQKIRNFIEDVLDANPVESSIHQISTEVSPFGTNVCVIINTSVRNKNDCDQIKLELLTKRIFLTTRHSGAIISREMSKTIEHINKYLTNKGYTNLLDS